MADKRTPRRTADPWADSVLQKGQRGKLRETHDTKKLQSKKEARRREDKSLQRGQNAGQTGGATVNNHRGNR